MSDDMTSDFEGNQIHGLSGLAKRAEQVIKGGLPANSTAEDRAVLVDDWLRWGLSEDPKARKRWAGLARKKFRERDRWVLDLWQSIAYDEGEDTAKSVIGEEASWDFYQRHFFNWFLGRFDVQAARAVFVPGRLASWFHYAVALVVVAISFLTLDFWAAWSLQVFGVLVILLSAAGFVSDRAGLPLYAYLNSLIPRLAVAVGIGYLFLFSAPHLVQMLNAYEPARHIWLTVAVLTFAALFYLMFHIHRRVDPPLAWCALLGRSFSVLVLAIAYSALELLVAAPILFSKPFLCGVSPKDCAVHADLHRLALCAAIALNLGVVLQLAWDEKPLTEPL